MSKTVKIYIGLLVVLFVGLTIIEFSKETPIDWSRTYQETDKIPYGTFVFYEELPNLFPDSDIEDIKVSPYEYFDDYYNWQDSTYSISGSYVHIDEYAAIDDVSAQELLDFASYGNDVFISTSYPPQKFYDSLGLDTEHRYDIKGEAEFGFTNSTFKNDSITIDKGLSNIYFSKLNSSITTVLGYQKFDSIKHINFVKIDYGYGSVYLHLQPVAFTNYHLLKKDNQKYAAAAMSYLPDDAIYYDYHSKVGQDLGSSPMRFVLSQPALRSAWYLALLSLVLFMIFNAKRKQRIVKVIKPLENTTVAFTKTIGNLYYETKDHNNLIDKKITYFLEYIRRVYYLDTQLLDDKFVKNLSVKSGKDKELTKKLIDLIVYLKAKPNCTESDLLNLNKRIEDFYNK
ncbi:DUF4350 domain-containing protein [Subsaxibacter sp. CAU 1640]|uniref:DUF4350 domain-containing protein n=1 Tax=Subsaxibacter sp. CAU 1640 TaxID=2933271 RepID=UPI0020062C52|nr:DUF4350 domain-containing protein [Subsaxibacter sp. CAU 1640]MCK7591583.1 DUF4350 domain-containing protein [Subsaxibacter sp. CAU 1640]